MLRKFLIAAAATMVVGGAIVIANSEASAQQGGGFSRGGPGGFSRSGDVPRFGSNRMQRPGPIMRPGSGHGRFASSGGAGGHNRFASGGGRPGGGHGRHASSGGGGHNRSASAGKPPPSHSRAFSHRRFGSSGPVHNRRVSHFRFSSGGGPVHNRRISHFRFSSGGGPVHNRFMSHRRFGSSGVGHWRRVSVGRPHYRRWSWGVGVIAAPAVAAPVIRAPVQAAPVSTAPVCYDCGGWTKDGCYMTWRKFVHDDGRAELRCIEACDAEPANPASYEEEQAPPAEAPAPVRTPKPLPRL